MRHKLECRMKDDHGDVKSSEKEVKQIWKEYFERLLNVEDRREVVISSVGMGRSKIERGREDERVVKEEVRKALKKMKSGKAPGVDGIACEMLKAGEATVIDWFTRVANVCMTERKVPRD